LPLEVRFFCSDVHKAWLKWSNLASEPIQEPLNIIQDFPSHEHTASDSQTGSPSRKKRKVSHGIAALDVGYANLKSYVEKAKGVIDFEREGACAVCHEDLEHDAGIYTICPNPECEAVTHMTCLSKHFLKNEENALVPVTGTCPSCKAKLRWIDVVKELSLRMRGQKEVEKLLKEKRVGKVKIVASSQVALESSDIEEDADDEAVEKEFEEEIMMIQELNPDTHGFDMDDSWHAIDDSDDSDTGSSFSNASKIREATSYQAGKAGGLGTVVEDTDWDDAEVLD
jgi:structure-specific endonuclease subunit SLX1